MIVITLIIITNEKVVAVDSEKASTSAMGNAEPVLQVWKDCAIVNISALNPPVISRSHTS
ncbi:unnamed protein product [Wuchereria bancrofti]|uniref:Uncharacterized protein n=1 Tax=Wuchereria bancrofti TaxID=6293 RepID=A0A3P7DT94_WUCBA|nr:unnamed protein product [Wuchereria bancrofti]